MATRIALDEDDFYRLVSGEQITKEGVEMILQDIGWDRMRTLIEAAVINHVQTREPFEQKMI